MKLFPDNLKACRIEDVTPGACFFFERKQTSIGIAIKPKNPGAPAPALLAVSPGHPGLNGRIGVLDGSVVQNNPIMIIPEARIIPSVDIEHVHLGCKSFKPPVGALFITGESDRLLSAIAYGEEAVLFNLEDGSENSSDEIHLYVWFSSWNIVVPTINGEWRTLCHVDVSSNVSDDA